MSGLLEILRQAVSKAGTLPFSQFMDLALYCPDFGYYERGSGQIGRQGDYFTSVSVGSLFGELLAAQFAEWQATHSGEPFQILEAGAHEGRLALDILTSVAANRGNQVTNLEYRILEPSPRRRAWQRATLGRFAPSVHWHDDWDALPRAGIKGVIFANELLDAMPVHRLGWDAAAQAWFEWGVKLQGGRFVWERMPLSDEMRSLAINAPDAPLASVWSESMPPAWLWARPPAELLAVLPDGFATEVCPAAARWWQRAANALARGRLLTFDYGFRAEEFFVPQRAAGTLMCYRRHRIGHDPLADPGEQDLTAAVNFTVLQHIGEAADLITESLAPQEEFLIRMAERWEQAGSHAGFWNSDRIRQFHTLTHPEHLGRALRVFVQRRKIFEAAIS